MSYLSLYRKWRSQDFEDIIGQPVIVQTLQNAIKNNRLAHAYLFSGPRGTGKTSTARILAKALNCQEGPTVKPCGKCPNCEKVRQGHAVDVAEIDAASNRGIDEIRELRERVRYAPLEGRYKVYIIDEVHMLTAEAFNALLKTLEEPPSHTIFILATTEMQKVPLTIASRCQRLDFGRIKTPEIRGRLREIAKGEKVEVDDRALDLIARSAEGGMRDAISLFDQLISFAGQKINYDNVVMLLGTADEDLLFAFADAMSKGAADQVLDLVRKGMEEGMSMPQVAKDLVGHFRNLLHLKVGSAEALELTEEYLKRLKSQAENFSLERIKKVMAALSRAEMDMKWHPHARLVLEVALLELLEGKEDQEIRETKKLKNEKTEEPKNGRTEELSAFGGKSGKVEEPVEKEAITVVSEDGNFAKIREHWETILESMRKKSIYGYVSLHEGEPVELNEKGKLVIGFRKGFSFHKERLEEIKNKEALEESIREVLGHRLLIECAITDGAAKKATLSVNTVAEFFEGRVVS